MVPSWGRPPVVAGVRGRCELGPAVSGSWGRPPEQIGKAEEGDLGSRARAGAEEGDLGRTTAEEGRRR